MKISESQKQFYQRIDEILLKVWDPKGIRKSPFARDEYEPYLHQIFGRLIRCCEREELITYLTKMETEEMGLGASPNMETRIGLVADLLLELKDELFLREST